MKLWRTIGKGLIAFWDYFRPSWEGYDKKFSYKRFSQFLFMWLIAYLVLNGIHDEWTFKTFVVLAILFSLTATIITTPDLIKMIKYYSRSQRTDYYNPGIYQDSHTGELPDTTKVTTETKAPVEPLPPDA